MSSSSGPENPYATPSDGGDLPTMVNQGPKRLGTRNRPCPRCSSKLSYQPAFTWWGGYMGPVMLNHVKCTQCGKGYNGKTGKSNNLIISIYLGAISLLLLVVCGGILLGSLK